jgi:hypothetical protein
MPAINARKLRIEVTTDTGTRVIDLAAPGSRPLRLVLDETVLATDTEDGMHHVAVQLVALGARTPAGAHGATTTTS